jgi:hypothetical protein
MYSVQSSKTQHVNRSLPSDRGRAYEIGLIVQLALLASFISSIPSGFSQVHPSTFKSILSVQVVKTSAVAGSQKPEREHTCIFMHPLTSGRIQVQLDAASDKKSGTESSDQEGCPGQQEA